MSFFEKGRGPRSPFDQTVSLNRGTSTVSRAVGFFLFLGV
jgi:hypothetical protein